MKSLNHVTMTSMAKSSTNAGQPTAEPEENLQITVPRATKKSLKLRSAETGDPMRVIVLRALATVGIQVPNEELKDRRKVK